MSSKQKIFRPSVRKRKAYATAFRVFFSYLWLRLKARLFGKSYYEKRIKALHLKNADRIKARVQELQGLFVKIGQIISNLSNILPEEFRGPLEELQDKVPPKPYAEIIETIRQQLGASPTEIFSSFEEEPLAAASIGQVHRAVLNGEQVVVKIQHQNIEVIARADLEILKNLVRLHAFFMDIQGMDHTYEQVKQMIEEELDYAREAESMKKIRSNLEEVPELRIKIPMVIGKYSTAKVLTSVFCEGVKISNVAAIAQLGVDQEDLARRLIELYCKMILVDGFYHADPHPGNILVNAAGEIILLDFGAMAQINDKFKAALPELIEALIRNDTEDTVQAMKKMGFLQEDRESRKYIEQLLGEFKTFIEEEVQFDGLNFQNIQLNSGLSSIASMVKKVNIRELSGKIKIPKDYILLNRTIVLLVGNAYNLAPTFNALDVVQPYMKKHIFNEEGGISKLLINTFKKQITTAVSLPHDFSRFLKNARESNIESDVRLIKTRLEKIYFLGQQFLYAMILIALVYFQNQPSSSTREYLFPGLIAVFGFLLLRSFYKDIRS